MTDAYTDELFTLEGADRLVFPVSRLLVDPERFRDDHDEIMASRGMGAVYTHTHDGRLLRPVDDREAVLRTFYDPHHQRLEIWAAQALNTFGDCLLVDCHSFPDQPLPCDLNHEVPRPDVCIGTDDVHTPSFLAQEAISWLKSGGVSVWLDKPYRGSIVPSCCYRKDAHVSTLMIELNRRLYMDELSGLRSPAFAETAAMTSRLLNHLASAFRETRV